MRGGLCERMRDLCERMRGGLCERMRGGLCESMRDLCERMRGGLCERSRGVWIWRARPAVTRPESAELGSYGSSGSPPHASGLKKDHTTSAQEITHRYRLALALFIFTSG